jgi:geranylgeranyl diphosphate synthase type I
MSMVSQAGLDSRLSRNVHKIISDMLLETGLGQGLDILYEDRPLEDFADGDHEIIDAYLYKTARYTITGPMLIGATMAKANPDLMGTLKNLGDLLGLAYQIKNDLEDLDKAYSDLDCSDLDTGKRTAILLHAYRALNPCGRKALTLLLDQPATPARRRELLTVLESSGAIDHAQQWVERLRMEALAAIGDLPLSVEKRQAFARLFALEGFSLV